MKFFGERVPYLFFSFLYSGKCYPYFLPNKLHQKLIQRQRYKKSNHAFNKTQKPQENINKQIQKKILKLKKLYQTSSPSKVTEKTEKLKKIKK